MIRVVLFQQKPGSFAGFLLCAFLISLLGFFIMMSIRTKIAITVAVLLWASAFVGIRAGLQDFSPEGLALLRFFVASCCMGLFYFYMPKRSRIHWRDVCKLLFSGAIGIGVYNVALNNGELVVSSGMASFIIGQSPIITAIVAVFMLGERLTLPRILGFLVSICGVALIVVGQEGGFHWDAYIAYIFLATVAGSVFTIIQKPLLKKYHAIEATTYVIWGGTLFLSMYAPQLSHEILHASLSSILLVIYLGVFPAAVGYVAWSYALSEIPAARATSFLYFIPFAATLLGWLWLGEVPAWLSLVGGLLGVMGVWLVNQSYRSPPVVVASTEVKAAA